ncbi:cation:proton antiporter [Hydrogenothermus marinus]|uniref:CPA2 family monovalent cation:H+ antiporter-2 n=1 Tax=Hydrogenothermus marinus TaxID=133270 RepID=A0A3M0BK60_9AQUI|nr:cation:proton antiporter [Hydrogenothermus marinus]RMA97567.1 CPA2 family monovalent cation:H+ antiporter-2 [Hydrogenothermus marinus]
MHSAFGLNFLILFGILMISLFIGGIVGKVLRLPSILFFILVGIFAGSLVHHDETIEKLSELGIILLFFYLGLEFNFDRAIETGKKILPIGTLDFLFNFVLIFAVMYLVFHFSLYLSLLAGGIAYASSSAITTKTIIDNHRIANPETELILGLMVFEDIVAPVILAIIAAFSIGTNPSFLEINIIFLKIALVFVGIWLISKYLKEYISKLIENILEDDIFILFTLGFIVLFAGFTKIIGLSEALGAFLAGLLIAETGKGEEVESLLISIKELAVAIFFMFFGASITFSLDIEEKYIFALLVIIILSIFGKFLTGLIGGLIYGLSKRSSIITGFSIINRGEFSIVMAKYTPPKLIPVVGIYVLFMAVIGTIFVQFADKLGYYLIPKKRKRKKKRNINEIYT